MNTNNMYKSQIEKKRFLTFFIFSHILFGVFISIPLSIILLFVFNWEIPLYMIVIMLIFFTFVLLPIHSIFQPIGALIVYSKWKDRQNSIFFLNNSVVVAFMNYNTFNRKYEIIQNSISHADIERIEASDLSFYTKCIRALTTFTMKHYYKEFHQPLIRKNYRYEIKMKKNKIITNTDYYGRKKEISTNNIFIEYYPNKNLNKKIYE